MTRLVHTWFMTQRQLRNLARQPYWIAMSLMQPVIYLLLFGSLFQRVAELPGFGTGSYITYLTPGIVIMSAFFGGGWIGMTMIDDLDRGILDRFLVTPVWRGAVVTGLLLQLAVQILIQSLIIVGLGLLLGARFEGGPLGVGVLLVCALLLAAAFGALSTGIALRIRKMESVIGIVNGVQLPLMFLSSVYMAPNLMPVWMQTIARYNPVNWAVEAARTAIGANGDWVIVTSYAGLLLALSIVCSWFATRALQSYRRSV
ncbi:MAG: ABC transporter permease [Chloroflexota bacterium]|nr:MAG: ABC transporter permease [Chloroflexota bacterium]